jgi:hypothetical protein
MKRKNEYIVYFSIIIVVFAFLIIAFYSFWIFFSPSAIENLSYEELGNGYYHTLQGDLVFIYNDKPKTPSIPFFVLDYKYDKKFITAKQLEYDLEENEKELWGNELYNLYLNKGKIQYWIIDKRIHKRYGPYEKIEFIKKCKELKVNNELFSQFKENQPSK